MIIAARRFSLRKREDDLGIGAKGVLINFGIVIKRLKTLGLVIKVAFPLKPLPLIEENSPG